VDLYYQEYLSFFIYKFLIYCPIPKNVLNMNNKLKIERNEIPNQEIVFRTIP